VLVLFQRQPLARGERLEVHFPARRPRRSPSEWAPLRSMARTRSVFNPPRAAGFGGPGGGFGRCGGRRRVGR
jgi:hypothetical protein